MYGSSSCPSWATLPPDILHLVYSCGPLRGDTYAWAKGEATCRAWRSGLRTFQPDNLVVSGWMGATPRQAAILVHRLATHPPVQLRHLWLPNSCPMDSVLEVAIRALPLRGLQSLRMTIHNIDSNRHTHFWWMQAHMSAFTGLTSLHLTLHFDLEASEDLHNHLGKLSVTLQDLCLAAPQGRHGQGPNFPASKRPKLELLVPLPHLTRLCLARPFQTVALDFKHMPELQRLELRTFSSIDGATKLSQCTQLSELEVFGSAAKKILPAATGANLRHLMLHHAPGAEKHCPSALVALTALRCLTLRGKHSSKLLPTEPMPSVQALFLDDANIQELFYGPAKLYSRLRVLHLAGARSEELMDCVIYPGLVQTEKMKNDSMAGSIYGLLVRYDWIEAMLRAGLPGVEQCRICPLESGGSAPLVSPQHLQTELHLLQLERFRQYAKDYKEEVAPPLALWHTLCQEVQRLAAGLPAAAPSLSRVHERLDLYGRNVMAALAAVEGARSWYLGPSLCAASGLMGQLTSAAQMLEKSWPQLSMGALAIAVDAQWAPAKAASLEKSFDVLVQQPVPGARLSERLMELGIKAVKPSQHGMLAPVGMQSEDSKPDPAQRAAAAVEGWKPAGASIRTASIEGWVRATRALGL